MAGFGIRALKKVQDDESQENKREYIPHIVYGATFYSVLTYLKLKNLYGEDKVKMILNGTIDKDSIIGEWRCSVNTLRSEIVAQKLMHKKPQLEVLPSVGKNAFYKDGKFHKFGGRAKPYELKEDEELFVEKFYNFKLEGLFEDSDWENLDELLSKAQLSKYIDKIETTKPTDLVEKTNFKLYTGELETYECENLYWCESPKLFYKKVENTSDLDDAMAAYCSALDHRTGLVVHFDVAGQIYEGAGTVFLPQSATHEWGHFIADIKPYDVVSERQEFSCLMFVDEDEVNEEELAKKIKLMKRVIERVLPDFNKFTYNERIQYYQDLIIKNTLDDLFPNYKDFPVRFIGQGGPLNLEDSKEIQFRPRGIMTYLDL